MNTNEVQLYSLIQQFLSRQDLVFQALKELRPHILISTGAVRREELEYIPKSRFDIPQSGFWGLNSEWKYFAHGLGCKLVHAKTREPIEWNAPNLNSFDSYWFINWLRWYLKYDIDNEKPDFIKFTKLDNLGDFILSSLRRLEEEGIIRCLSSQYPNEYTLSLTN